MNLTFEIEKLRSELQHLQEMYAMAQNENVDASKKVQLKIFEPHIMFFFFFTYYVTLRVLVCS